MPCADFSVVFSAGCPSPSGPSFRTSHTAEISRGKTRILPRIGAGFTKCTHPGVATEFADGGLGGHVPTGPGCITPHIRFLFMSCRPCSASGRTLREAHNGHWPLRVHTQPRDFALDFLRTPPHDDALVL
jgi:hypothetical protein